MDKETIKILTMIQEGKISAEEGAKLLEALESSEQEEKIDSISQVKQAR